MPAIQSNQIHIAFQTDFAGMARSYRKKCSVFGMFLGVGRAITPPAPAEMAGTCG